jgi:RNA ligase
MIYDFANIKTIDPILEVIKDKPEFIVANRDWYNIVNYMVNKEDTFPNITSQTNKKELPKAVLLRELRGIAFDENGEIIHRSLHKFFNLNERHETMQRLIDFKEPHVMLDKLDGSMLRPLFNRQHNGFRMATKMGVTDVAFNAEVFVSENPKYFKLFRYCWDNGLSPTFEWCSELNRIVILYKDDNLVLTAIRGLHDGKYMPYHEMVDLGAKFDIPVVGAHDSVTDIDAFLAKLNDYTNIEGFIVRFDTGQMLKIKTDEYCLQHKSKDIVSSKRQIIELVLDEKIDDIKPRLIQEDLDKVAGVEKEVFDVIQSMSTKLNDVHARYKHMDKKNFALNIADKLTPFERKGFFSMMDGKQPIELVRQFLRSNVGNNVKLQALKDQYKVFVDAE